MNRLRFRMYIQGLLSKKKEAMGVVEIILIIVVLIGLVLIFKTQITNLVKTIFGTINSKALTI